MTNKKITELIQATQINDADELAVVQSGVTKRVTKQVFQESLSVESGTTVNLESIGTMDNAQVSNFNTGKSSVFNESGTLGGTLDFDIVNNIRGKQSLRYTNNFIASNSDGDWFSRDIGVPNGYAGRVFEFNFQYTNQFTTGSVRVKVLDDSDRVLIDELLPNQQDNLLAKEFSRKFNVYESVSTLTYGFHVITGESSSVFKIDDVQITPNIREISNFVVESKDDSVVMVTGANGTGGTNTAIRRFTNLDTKIGSSVSYADSASDGSSFMAEEDGIYHISYTESGNISSTDVYVAISRNSNQLSTTPASVDSDDILAMERNYTGASTLAYFNASWSGYLRKGDVIRPHVGTGVGGDTKTRFTITKAGGVKNFPALENQKVEIPHSSLILKNQSSTGFTNNRIRWDDVVKQSGDSFVVDQTDGTVITIKKSGLVFISAMGASSIDAHLYIYKNSTAMSGQWGLNGKFVNTPASFRVIAGDVITFALTSPISSSEATLNFVHVETEVSVNINTITPQYEDSTSYVRLHTTNGYGAVNTVIRRFSAVVENKGSAVTYSDDSNNGASFIINEDGVYSISYTDLFGTAARFGISLNSNQLSTSISSINPNHSLALTLTGSSNWTETVAWSGELKVGDVIRPHTQGATDNSSNAEGKFSIVKHPLPSVVGIDGRPLDAYHKKEDSLVDILLVSSTYGAVATKCKSLLSDDNGIITTKGDSFSVYDDGSDSYIEILSDGKYEISHSDSFNVSADFGVSLNAGGTVDPNGTGSDERTTNFGSFNDYDSRKLAGAQTGGDNIGASISWSGNLRKGDRLRAHSEGAGGGAGVRRITVSRTGDLIRSIPLVDSTVDLSTSTVKFSGSATYGSTNTFVVQYSQLESITGEDLIISNDDGTFVTTKKDGFLAITAMINTNTASDVGIVRNPSNTTVNVIQQDDVLTNNTDSQGDYAQTLSWQGMVKAGESFVIMADGAPISGARDNTKHFTVTFIDTKIAVALSNVKPQFEDVDSSVKLHTSNGYGSVATKIRRFSNLVLNKGSAVTYNDSASEGASFLINEDGTYHIHYSDAFTGSSDLGISLNASSLSTNIQSISNDQVIAIGSTPDPNAFSSVSTTVFLRKGDIIRAHTNGSGVGILNKTSFSISKVSNPSVTEIDTTPFADFNTNEWSTNSVRAFGNSQEIVGAGQATPFKYINGSGFSGDTYIVQNPDAIIELNFGTLFTTSFGRSYDLYVNGNTYKRISQLVTNDQHVGSFISSRGEFQRGDELTIRLAQGSGTLSNNRVYHYLSINEHYVSSVYERVHLVEDNENIFSAKIVNNGTASILSQSVDFIESVNRPSQGYVDIKFKSGFFTETPSIIVTDTGASTYSESIFSQTINGCTIRTFNHENAQLDVSFDIIVQRQGSDYRDLQRQIVSLKDFPKVNNQLMQYFEGASGSATDAQIINAVVSSEGDKLAVYESGTFTVLKDGKASVSIRARANSTTSPGVSIRVNGIQKTNANINQTVSFVDTASWAGLVKKGDEISFFAEDSINAVSFFVLFESLELKPVGNISGGENVFSAKIQNNGVASIISQSSDFIDGVNRTATGFVDITFKAGFFSEIPSLQVHQTNYDVNGYSPRILNLTTNGCTIKTILDGTGAQDINFDVIAHRQGSDYRDVQEQIIQLEDFPRVNRTLTQEIYNQGTTTNMGGITLSGTGLGGLSLFTFNDPLVVSGDEILQQASISGSNGTKFVAKKKCRVSGQLAVFNNGAAFASIEVIKVAKDGSTILHRSRQTITASDTSTLDVSYSYVLEPGQQIHLGYLNGIQSFAGFSCVAEAQDLERIDNVDAAENTLTLSFNSTTNAIVASNTDKISISDAGVGRYDLDYSGLNLTNIPAILVSADHHGGTSLGTAVYVTSVTTTGAQINLVNVNETFYEFGTIHVSLNKQGDDYKNLKDVVVSLPENKTKWQTKYLSGDITAAGAVSDLSFSNLVAGRTYKLTSRALFEFIGNNGAIELLFTNGGNVISRLRDSSNDVQTNNSTRSDSVIFIATGSTITCTAAASTPYVIRGDGTMAETFATLEELPLHEQTSEWT